MIEELKSVINKIPAVIPYLTGRARWLAFASQEAKVKTYEYYLLELERMIYNVYSGSLGGSFIDIMANLISGQIRQAYQKAWIDSGYQLPLPPYMEGAAEAMILNQYDYVDGLYRAIIDARVDGTPIDPLLARAKLWAARWNEAYQDGVRLITEKEGGNMIWVLGEAEHCETCINLSGIVASAREWTVLGIAPKSQRLKCKGYNCECELVPTTKRRSPNAYGRIEEALL